MEFGYMARPIALPPEPLAVLGEDLEFAPQGPAVFDITQTPFGQEIRALLAWGYATQNGCTQWPHASWDSLHKRWRIEAYEREVKVMAFTPYGERWREDTCPVSFGVLNGSPMKAMAIVIPWVDVGDETGGTCRGWKVIMETGGDVRSWFYDPWRRLLWRFGDRYKTTRIYRVPSLDEVRGRAAPNTDAHSYSSYRIPRHEWWMRPLPAQAPRRQSEAMLEQARRLGYLIVSGSPQRFRHPIQVWEKQCALHHIPCVIVYLWKNRRTARVTLHTDALHQDTYRQRAFSLDDLHRIKAVFNEICSDLPSTVARHYSFYAGGHFAELFVPRERAEEAARRMLFLFSDLSLAVNLVDLGMLRNWTPE